MLKYIVIHCSANRADTPLTAEDIAAYHTRPQSKGGLGFCLVQTFLIFALLSS